jgi:hypothetical protein
VQYLKDHKDLANDIEAKLRAELLMPKIEDDSKAEPADAEKA